MPNCCICGKKVLLAYAPLTARGADGKRLVECMPCYKKAKGGLISIQGNQATIIDNKDTEVKQKCNVCGNVFCYTYSDVQKNIQQAKSAALSSVSGIAGALAGQNTAAAVNIGNADNSLNRITDFSKCPKCNSTDLRTLSEADFLIEQQLANKPQASASAVSSADELKKFKELLDSGVITQEEFDAKKKQLLGL